MRLEKAPSTIVAPEVANRENLLSPILLRHFFLDVFAQYQSAQILSKRFKRESNDLTTIYCNHGDSRWYNYQFGGHHAH
jgi:hypothetical protein